MPSLGDYLAKAGTSLGDVLQDPQFYRDMAANVPDAARGLLAQTAGAPVDMTAMMMRPFGYKTPDANVVGSTDWIGKKLGADVERMPFRIASMLPNDPGDLMRGATLAGSILGKAINMKTKIAKSSGEPILMFHGTNSAYKDYRPGKGGELAWFAQDPNRAAFYAQEKGGNIRPAYVAINNPAKINDYERLGGNASAANKLKEQGFDGVMYKDDNGQIVALPFSSPQIVSSLE